MEKRDLIVGIQRRVAVVCIGPSTFRGNPAGSLGCARAFLTKLSLGTFATNSESRFRRTLDLATARLMRALPRRARTFGLARKALNLFLRDAFYNHDLRSQFGLGRARRLLEVPIDSVVAKELRRRVGPEVPAWPSLRALAPETHALYQMAALNLARQMRTWRVHLDTFLWVEGK